MNANAMDALMDAPEREMKLAVFSGLEGVRERWRALQARGLATPFQTLEWCERLYAGPGAARNAEPIVAVVSDAASGEDLALLPLARTRRGALSLITFADFGLSDYAFPVMAGAFSSAGAAWLRRRLPAVLPAADVIHFEKMLPAHAGAPNPLIAPGKAKEMSLGGWVRRLPADWEDFEPSLTKRSRRALRQRGGKLERLGEVRHFLLRGGEDAGRLLDSLRRMRMARFAALGRDDAFADEAVYAFYRDLAESGAGGLGLLSALKLDGEVAAVVFGVMRGKRFYMLAMAFRQDNDELAKCSPGLVLVHRTMKALHEEGLEVYDFTIGDERYKHTFGAHREALLEHVRPLTAKGRLFAAGKEARRRARLVRRLLQNGRAAA